MTETVLPARMAAGDPLMKQKNLRGKIFHLVDPLPDRCVRHGRSAVAHPLVNVLSDPDVDDLHIGLLPHGWGSPLMRWAARMQRAVVVQEKWPLCRICDRLRRWGLRGFTALVLCGILLVVASVVARILVGEPRTAITWMVVTGFALLPLSLLPLSLIRVQWLLRANTVTDGSAVIVKRPHPTFAEEARQISEAHRASH
ncbi:hypothetical protein G4X40_14195 [Rhodococcus sp. D2-41]|uniref:Uncharacterized protein n=1 Tax=Speluncibacter jeojiensis TaxID=2710754 RepID=A0A9X4RI75_9ACTN|nr:hypothetical protein [Rhodococcus sp. D2-41]MDG3011303.1 hypothetical protein [Rhodococcus sp. D2-41]MDG3015846.1 hypothetical protein [Corynebacteriales bacterium D3-21]